MDRAAFEQARKKITGDRVRSGIGTLGEKTVHAVLKEYYGGGDESKEIAVGGFVADVVCEDGIVEIQTRALYRLDRKLTALLPLCRVTVVYPVEQEKYLLTIDPDSGELLSRRKSPKKMGVWHGIAELYSIRGHLTDENLTVRLPLLTVEETRLPAAGRYKRAKKLDKLPLSITDEPVLHGAEDYAALLPEGLPDKFTAAEMAKLCRINAETARKCIGTLRAAGVLRECGKRGRCKLWEKL
ncbi:hypothetical protein [uncultured Ruminococcus sp.]|uniref:hypothetical protein n=1 Tax=uncultured Ruminococcus sp. TaxID=165186 RepID=UPI0025EF2CDF|nr:hypothetical protein [uncultured Ruminococcus sp.]